eukprot:scaffold1136_cov260-Pinguiococcus_pyrenoidosus.AAC.1
MHAQELSAWIQRLGAARAEELEALPPLEQDVQIVVVVVVQATAAARRAATEPQIDTRRDQRAQEPRPQREKIPQVRERRGQDPPIAHIDLQQVHRRLLRRQVELLLSPLQGLHQRPKLHRLLASFPEAAIPPRAGQSHFHLDLAASGLVLVQISSIEGPPLGRLEVAVGQDAPEVHWPSLRHEVSEEALRRHVAHLDAGDCWAIAAGPEASIVVGDVRAAALGSRIHGLPSPFGGGTAESAPWRHNCAELGGQNWAGSQPG